MNENIIKYYMVANKLKKVLRTGWLELKVSSERIESAAEHVYGCLVLAIGLEGVYKLDLDMLKVMKMIIIKELKKVNLKETTTRDYLKPDYKEESLSDVITEITDGVLRHDEIVSLIKECEENQSKEARFVYQLSKIEADLQAKIYDLNGYMSMEDAKEDAKYFGEDLASEIIPQMKNASDSFILYNRRLYIDDMFKNLSQDIQGLKK